VTNGLITFTSGTFNSLSDIASSTSILTGNRISNKGNMSTNNNYLAVSIGVFTLPQFFTPNSTFGATITLTLVNT